MERLTTHDKEVKRHLLSHPSCLPCISLTQGSTPTNKSNMESPLPTPTTNSHDDDELLLDHPPLFRVYKSGRVERLLGTATVPAGDDPATGVSSKDVTLFPGVSARLFLPLHATITTDKDNKKKKKKKLPVLIYYHGGGFIIESASSPTYVTFLNALCSAAGVLAISVDYRRAPEHPLPAAYDDSYAALQWALSPAGAADPWLAEHGDLGAVLLGGDSAGANIAHHVLLRHAASGAPPLLGAILIHPFFWGTTEVGPRSAEARKQGLIEKLWRSTCPATSGLDDPLLNPLAEAAEALGRVGCGRVLVCVAEKDILMEWGWAYYKGLAAALDGRVEMVETKGEDHVFHLKKPNSDEANDFIRRLADFINQHAPLK